MNGFEDVAWLLFGVLLMAAGGWVFLVLMPRTWARAARALPTEGVVESFLWGDPLGMPTVRYTDASGAEHTATSPNGPASRGKGTARKLVDERQRVQVGQRISIRYDPSEPSEPSWIRIEGFPTPDTTYRGLGLALLAIGAMTTVLSLG